MAEHIPVLLDETVAGLNAEHCHTIVDGTYGRGGHARAVLEHLPSDARYYAFDKDLTAIEVARQHALSDARVHPIHTSFAKIETALAVKGVTLVDAVMLDLGVSSPQLDDASRGFSFNKEGPLDMRMNTEQQLSAERWVNTATEAQIATVLFEYGQEKKSRVIARRICQRRQESPFTTTQQLAELIREIVPSVPGKDGATRSFQAIRMHVNAELEDLHQGLAAAFKMLRPGGRMCVISFHSLEDGIVKRFMQSLAKPKLPKGVALTDDQIPRYAVLIGKAIKPSESELHENPRSRSATLRIVEKL
jgi:16S rRNA (cytosine1402-N4)-methyltransferase